MQVLGVVESVESVGGVFFGFARGGGDGAVVGKKSPRTWEATNGAAASAAVAVLKRIVTVYTLNSD